LEKLFTGISDCVLFQQFTAWFVMECILSVGVPRATQSRNSMQVNDLDIHTI